MVITHLFESFGRKSVYMFNKQNYNAIIIICLNINCSMRNKSNEFIDTFNSKNTRFRTKTSYMNSLVHTTPSNNQQKPIKVLFIDHTVKLVNSMDLSKRSSFYMERQQVFRGAHSKKVISRNYLSMQQKIPKQLHYDNKSTAFASLNRSLDIFVRQNSRYKLIQKINKKIKNVPSMKAAQQRANRIFSTTNHSGQKSRKNSKNSNLKQFDIHNAIIGVKIL